MTTIITEDYVSFETAKLLKDKGFDEGCPTTYTSNGFFHTHNYKPLFGDIFAPTLQMAMKWLREKHNLFIQVTVDFSDGAYPMYDACVVNLAICTSVIVIGYNRYSYTQACETTIKYCLENLI